MVMNDKFNEYWDNRHSENMYSGYLVANEFIGRRRFEYERASINSLLYGFTLQGKSVLDLACGNGFTSVHFAKLGANVIATDLSPSVIDLNKVRRDHPNIKWIVSDALVYLLETTDYFDLIYVGGLAPYLNDNQLNALVKTLFRFKSAGSKIIWREIYSYRTTPHSKFLDSDGICRSLSNFKSLNLRFISYNYGYLFQPVALTIPIKSLYRSLKILTVLACLLRIYRMTFRMQTPHRHSAFFIL